MHQSVDELNNARKLIASLGSNVNDANDWLLQFYWFDEIDGCDDVVCDVITGWCRIMFLCCWNVDKKIKLPGEIYFQLIHVSLLTYLLC